MSEVKNEFEPFGPEWEKEMMKFTKKMLIDFLRQNCIQRVEMQEAFGLIGRHFPKDILADQMGEDFHAVARCLPL